MSGLFSSPSMPAPPAAPPPPIMSASNEKLKDAARLESERLKKRKGFKSTWLTAGMGDFNEQTQKAQLLGGGG